MDLKKRDCKFKSKFMLKAYLPSGYGSVNSLSKHSFGTW
jgi:hypothetical protein